MDELHRCADKLDRDLTHLYLALEHGKLDLALSIAKRVRRNATLLTRAIAAENDANTQEGNSE
jgi:hypothetical protein